VSRLRSTFAAFVAIVMATVVAIPLAPVAAAADTSAEAETMTLSPPTAGKVVNDATASGGKAMQIKTNGEVSVNATLPASTKVSVVAKGLFCWVYPSMTIKVDGQAVKTVTVNKSTWTTYTADTAIPAGSHTISVAFTNDYNLLPLCDSALMVDKLSVVAGTVDPPAGATCADPPPSSTSPLVENFDGPANTPPNPALWSYMPGGGALQVNTDSVKNGSLDGNGNLTINALKEQVTVPGYGTYNYTSALLHTLDKFEMCYGTLRARVKVPNGKGMRPSFYLLGANALDVGWPAAGELDILDAADRLAGSGMHGTGFSLATQAPVEVTGDWHEFWMRWERDKVVTGVDNQEIATYTPASLPNGAQWPFNDHPMFVIFSLAVGGAGQGGPPDSNTVFPATMYVDWLKYDPPVAS
jgi:beta-glucanase (GH16 family)